MKKDNKQGRKQHSEGSIFGRSAFASFNTPIKGVLDVLLIMTITILAVVYLGPIVIGGSSNVQDKNENHIYHSDYICSETGKVIKDYLFDETGEKYGWVDIEYHENGAFKQVTEHNERDNTTVKVFYSEDNEFLYWIEIQTCEDGDVVSEKRFAPDGSLISG